MNIPEWLVILITGSTFFSVVVMNYVLSPILPRIAVEFGVTTGQAGQLVTVYGLLFATSALLLGSVSAWFGRRKMIAGALVAFGLTTICTGLAPTFGLMMLFRGISGLAASVVQTLNWTVVASSIPYARRGQATGWVMQAGTLALLGGVPLGGFLAQYVSWHVIFYSVGGFALAMAGLMWFWLPPDETPQGTGAPLRDSFGGMRRLFAQSQVRRAYGVSFLTWAAMFCAYTYLGAFLTERFNLNTAQVSQITLVLGVGYALGSQAGGRLSDRFGREPVIVGGLLLMIVVFLLLPHVLTAAAAMLLIALLGFGYFFSYSSQVTVITEFVPESRGLGMAANYFVTYVGAAAGAQVGGWVFGGFTYTTVGLVAAGTAVLAVALAGRPMFAHLRLRDTLP